MNFYHLAAVLRSHRPQFRYQRPNQTAVFQSKVHSILFLYEPLSFELFAFCHFDFNHSSSQMKNRLKSCCVVYPASLVKHNDAFLKRVKSTDWITHA